MKPVTRAPVVCLAVASAGQISTELLGHNDSRMQESQQRNLYRHHMQARLDERRCEVHVYLEQCSRSLFNEGTLIASDVTLH